MPGTKQPHLKERKNNISEHHKKISSREYNGRFVTEYVRSRPGCEPATPARGAFHINLLSSIPTSSPHKPTSSSVPHTFYSLFPLRKLFHLSLPPTSLSLVHSYLLSSIFHSLFSSTSHLLPSPFIFPLTPSHIPPALPTLFHQARRVPSLRGTLRHTANRPPVLLGVRQRYTPSNASSPDPAILAEETITGYTCPTRRLTLKYCWKIS